VAVDGAVIDVDLVVVGRIHQGIAAFYHTGPLGQRLQDQEFGHGERHRRPVPRAGVALRVHHQRTALDCLRALLARCRHLARIGASQHRLDPLDQEALREGLPDEVVGAHLQTEQLVDLLVLRGEKDDGDLGLLAQPSQQFHAVHARHLDVEDRQIRRRDAEPLERGGPVGVGLDPVAFRLQRQRHGGQDVAIVVDEGDGWHLQRTRDVVMVSASHNAPGRRKCGDGPPRIL